MSGLLIEEQFAPDLFVNFGLFGVVTFLIELRRFYTQRLVWAGIETLFEITKNGRNSDAVLIGAFGVSVLGVISRGISDLIPSFISGVGAGSYAISGVSSGVHLWYKTKNEPDYRRFFAALAFPLFCWLPITVCYSTLAFLNFLSVWQVALLWGTIVLPCAFLWFYGQHKDYQARNPLQGIPELEKYYREPR